MSILARATFRRNQGRALRKLGEKGIWSQLYRTGGRKAKNVRKYHVPKAGPRRDKITNNNGENGEKTLKSDCREKGKGGSRFST